MKRWAWILVALCVTFGITVAWFWSLAAIPSEAAASVTLRVDRSPVEVRMPDNGDFRPATNGTVLPTGTTIRTGQGGRATVVFFDQAESRLDVNSEMTISNAALNSDAGQLNVDARLSAGRVWSRVLPLFDPESSFSIRTSGTMVSARGTAFDVSVGADGKTEVWVSDAAVTVLPASDAAIDARFLDALIATSTIPAALRTYALAAGEHGTYDARGAQIRNVPIAVDQLASSWFVEHRASDEIFLRSVRERVQLAFQGAIAYAQSGLTKQSEWVHMALARGAARERLALKYAAMRLASVVALAGEGKTGQAAAMLARIETDLHAKLEGPDAVTEGRRLAVALQRIAPLLQDAVPASPSYPFKQRAEDLNVAAARDDKTAALFARMLAIDARLDEANQLMDAGMLDEARMAIAAAQNGLVNIRRNAAGLGAETVTARRTAVIEKLLALMVRTTTETARLNVQRTTSTSSDSGATTSTASGTDTGLAPDGQPGSATSTSPPPTPTYVGITVTLKSQVISVGETATVIVTGRRADGSTKDVTSRTSIRIVQGDGAISGARFTATQAGTVTIQASFNDVGVARTAQAIITVQATVIPLSGLSVSASPETITPGATAQLTVVAAYENGDRKQVTQNVTWENLTPSLGTLLGNAFTASQAIGTVRIQATYTEGGVAQIVIANIQIGNASGTTGP